MKTKKLNLKQIVESNKNFKNALIGLNPLEVIVALSMAEVGFKVLSDMHFDTSSSQVLVKITVENDYKVNIKITSSQSSVSWIYNRELTEIGTFVKNMIDMMNLEA